MKRIFIAILFFVLGVGIAQAIVPVQTDHASDTVLTVKDNTTFQQAADLIAPETAAAAVGNVRVQNVGVSSFKIYCNYGSSSYKTLSSGQNSQQSGKCTADSYDTDQVLVTTTRCVKFVGPVKADGYYRLQPSIRAKVPDLSTFAVHPLSFCDDRGSGYKGYWTYR